MVECVRGSGCVTFFVLSFSGPMLVSPLSLHLYYYLLLTAVCVFCYNNSAVIHGWWVDRFVGVTVVLRSAVLL